MKFFPQLLCIFLQDRLLSVQHSHVHFQIRPAGFLSFQVVIQFLNLQSAQPYIHTQTCTQIVVNAYICCRLLRKCVQDLLKEFKGICKNDTLRVNLYIDKSLHT